MRPIEPQDEPLFDGARVYVKPLDVFGQITGLLDVDYKNHRYTYSIECEAPMPKFKTTATTEQLYLP